MKTLISLLVIISSAVGQEAGFQPLFDGKTLKGWDGDPRLWSVRDGAIVGSTEGVSLTDNSFLISKEKYSDFILRAETKLRNHNSGIQFRSEALPNWVVRGLQADMAQGNWWGSIYDEKGKRGTVVNGWKGKGETVLRPNDWNDYEITCNGDLIQLKLNGLLTAELHDIPESPRTGIIALQLHKGVPMEVQFRNIRIKQLNNGRQAGMPAPR
ncbi:MAG: DUF1080 domain-containing protein [Acidobacteriota bacterium]|nr:DUF1080 domain-containing protein [Acidobacteriota bacterium]